jgi:hypothetical protein
MGSFAAKTERGACSCLARPASTAPVNIFGNVATGHSERFSSRSATRNLNHLARRRPFLVSHLRPRPAIAALAQPLRTDPVSD